MAARLPDAAPADRDLGELSGVPARASAVLEARYAAAPRDSAPPTTAPPRKSTNAACCCGRASSPTCGAAAGRRRPMTPGGRRQSEAPAYRYYYRCVQLIGSNEPEKRWLLKNPGHIENLDLLFAVYPDAKVIQTHRDPAKAVPVAGLAADEPAPDHGGRPRRAARARSCWRAKWRSGRTPCARPTRCANSIPARCSTSSTAISTAIRWRVLERIYAFIGMDIPDDTARRFAQRIEEKPELAARRPPLQHRRLRHDRRGGARALRRLYPALRSAGDKQMKAAIYPGQGKPIVIEDAARSRSPARTT